MTARWKPFGMRIGFLFRRELAAGAPSVLVSHTIVSCMDDSLPASLSPAVHRLLRDDWGFDGIIMTDDLSMSAICTQYGLEEAAILAVQAGNDLLISSDFEVQIPAILQAVQQGAISPIADRQFGDADSSLEAGSGSFSGRGEST